jgi:hypothetical protein
MPWLKHAALAALRTSRRRQVQFGVFLISYSKGLLSSVPDPNPDPRVFWPSGSRATSPSFIVQKNKNLESYFVTLFDFLSLKNNVNPKK